MEENQQNSSDSDYEDELINDAFAKYKHMWGADILDECIREENDNPKFKRREARVSAVGLCQKRAVAAALGMIQTVIPFEYIEAGFMLQEKALQRFKGKFPLTEQEVTVNTVIPGVKTHPDIIIPELSLCIQVKSTGDKNFAKGPGIKEHYRDQILLEWKSWQRSKYCITESGQRIDIVPQRYELMYLSRDTYGKMRKSYEIKWDPIRARILEEKFQETQNLIELEILPEKPFKSPNWECKIPNYPPCPLYEACWGKKQEIKQREEDVNDRWWEA